VWEAFLQKHFKEMNDDELQAVIKRMERNTLKNIMLTLISRAQSPAGRSSVMDWMFQGASAAEDASMPV